MPFIMFHNTHFERVAKLHQLLPLRIVTVHFAAYMSNRDADPHPITRRMEAPNTLIAVCPK